MPRRWCGGIRRAESGGRTLEIWGHRRRDLSLDLLRPTARDAGVGRYPAARRDLAPGELPRIPAAETGYAFHHQLVTAGAATRVAEQVRPAKTASAPESRC